MILPLVAALFQGIAPPSKATAADSAYVRSMLDSAAASIQSVGREYYAALTLIEQLHIWRGDDAAWKAALGLDQDKIASEHYYTSWVLAKVIREGKRDKARDYLLALPMNDRDRIIASLPNFMGNVPLDILPLLDSLTTSVEARAQTLFRRAVSLRRGRNSSAARDTMRVAVDVLRRGGIEHYPLEWAMELLLAGEPVAVAKLIELGAKESGNTGRVAQIMGIHGVFLRLRDFNPKQASQIADTLLRHLPDDTTFYAGIVKADLLQMRAAPGDSATATRLREAMRVKYPRPRALQNIDYELYDVFRQVSVRHDSAGLERALERWRAGERSARALITATRGIQRGASWYRSDVALPIEEREWGSFAFRRLWATSALLQPPSRDSTRLELIKVLARMDPAAALDIARKGFSTRSTRDHAVAEALRKLVSIDAELTEREASKLKDQSARDVAYSSLTSTGIAGGRLKEARRFANAVSRGSTTWVTSQFAIAQTLAKTGARAEVVQILREILPHLRSIPECSGCLIVEGAPPAEPAHHRREIVDILSVALQHGLYGDVSAWAATRPSASARVWAWLEVAQAVSFVKLGRYPDLPIHGR